jgi:hypothetical protein
MTTQPQPLVFQFAGPDYVPIPMLQMGGCNYRIAAPSGTAGSGVSVPPGAKSVRVQSLGGDVWLKPDLNTPSTVTVAVPSGSVVDGSVPDLTSAGSADTYNLPAGIRFLVLFSSADVLLTWFA